MPAAPFREHFQKRWIHAQNFYNCRDDRRKSEEVSQSESSRTTRRGRERRLRLLQRRRAIIHIHARDPEGNLSSDPKIYRTIHEKIRARCDIILQDTTGGGPNLTLDQRLASLEADPEMASLNMGTMVRLLAAAKGTMQFNPPWEIERFARAMLERNAKAEMEVYNPSMFRDVRNVIEKGLVKKPYYINLVIGINFQGGLDPVPQSLIMMLDAVPKREDAILNVSGIRKAPSRSYDPGDVIGCQCKGGDGR